MGGRGAGTSRAGSGSSAGKTNSSPTYRTSFTASDLTPGTRVQLQDGRTAVYQRGADQFGTHLVYDSYNRRTYGTGIRGILGIWK